ncbi:MAG TPA: diacylglycerol kinase family lipid kinase [Candidatus Hydrothermia bacterium]|nr:diacylglycerol kinase family lipid kinase [Candidatus Hydrothermia bacterium]
MERAVIIVNPESRNSRRFKDKRTDVLKILSEVFDVYIWETMKAGDGMRLAERALEFGAGVIISAGGDGTLNEIVNKCAGKDVKVGILPLGVTNVFAISQKIPRNLVKAAQIIVKDHVKLVDLGLVNEKRYFHMMLGAGIDGFTIKEIPHEFKKALGAPAHVVIAVMKYPEYSPVPIYIEIDGQDYGIGYEVVVANIPNYGGKMKMAPAAVPDDGLLDVVIFREAGFIKDISHWLGFLMGFHHKMGTIDIHRGKSCRLVAQGVYYHLDSEFGGELPVEITCVNKALRLLSP